ncbi:Hypothetical predicted protein, partial [Olea europaea subsp. europaea]
KSEVGENPRTAIELGIRRTTGFKLLELVNCWRRGWMELGREEKGLQAFGFGNEKLRVDYSIWWSLLLGIGPFFIWGLPDSDWEFGPATQSETQTKSNSSLSFSSSYNINVATWLDPTFSNIPTKLALAATPSRRVLAPCL